MRSHAKASSAGSSMRQPEGLGRIVRGAFATRGASSDAEGTGAPAYRRARISLSLFATLFALAVLAASAFAAKDVTTYIGNVSGSGSKGGEMNGPRDSAVNDSGAGPANVGDIYLADEANNRIQRFDSEGNFTSAWGANATHRDESQKVAVDATTGTYTLSFEGDSTEAIDYDANESEVDSALGALPSISGDVNVTVTSTGSGGTQTYTVVFTGALSGTNFPQMTADTDLLEGSAEVSTVENGSGGGGNDYEICTLASKCGRAVASGGNLTAAGNGALDHPQSVAVDQGTGNVYVSDRGNRRVDEYDGEGNFIRAFGWDVAESGPDNTGTEYEVCNEGEADVCKVGEGGSGVGQYGTGEPENGFGVAVGENVFLADSGNQRVDTFELDGTSPTSFGSSANFGSEQPRSVAVDGRGILYASDSNSGGGVQRYDSEDANGGGVGFLAPILPPSDEVQKIEFTGFAAGDQYKLTCPDGTPTGELAYTAGTGTFGVPIGKEIIQNGLEEACGSGNVSTSGNPPNTTVTFQGDLAGSNQPQMTCTALSGSGSCSVSTT
ncbi:MAG: NHL repeat-containing protein, partial [Solirubrobacterales bacterium]